MTSFETLLTGRPLVAVLRGVAADTAVALAHEIWDTGLGVVEVPIQTPDAVATLTAVVAAGRERGECCGAGTVVSAEQVEVAARAGATFTVAPGLDLAVLTASEAAGLPHLPGVGTATEVHQALQAGATFLKAFPAASLGPGWIRDLRGPFPGASFVATGGITAANAAEFLAAGAVAVGVGGSITRPGGLGPVLAALRGR